jgi:hypothetical protein
MLEDNSIIKGSKKKADGTLKRDLRYVSEGTFTRYEKVQGVMKHPKTCDSREPLVPVSLRAEQM